MRVRVTDGGGEERGAIAIMVAVLALVLMVSGAIVVDFGMAYVNKRQAQTAADAAVLAAGKIYQTQTGACSTYVGNASLKSQAQTAADALRAANMPGSTGSTLTVACNADGELEVGYDVQANSAVGLGGVVTGNKNIVVSRTATATFDRPLRGESGMRPWPICSNSIPDDWQTHKVVVEILAGNKTNVGCPGMEISGTWGRFACPGYAKGDGSDKDDKPTSSIYWIRYGCPNPASPVPGQKPYESDPSALRSYLVNYCAGIGKNDPSTEFCLARDTGNAQNKKMDDAWQMVIDAGKTIEIPVFCSPADCSSDAVTAAPVIPIYQLAVVRICGGYLPTTHYNWSSHAECNGSINNPNGYSKTTATTGGKAAFYFVVEGLVKSTDSSSDGGSSNLRLTQ